MARWSIPCPVFAWSVDAALAVVRPAAALRDLRPLIGPPVRDILAAVSGVADRNPAGPAGAGIPRQLRLRGMAPDGVPGGRPGYALALLTSGAGLWVVTNKPALATGRILRELKHSATSSGRSLCRDSRTPPLASKAEMLIDLVTRQKLDREECLMVGDTAEDWHAAEAAGIALCDRAARVRRRASSARLPAHRRMGS